MNDNDNGSPQIKFNKSIKYLINEGIMSKIYNILLCYYHQFKNGA